MNRLKLYYPLAWIKSRIVRSIQRSIEKGYREGPQSKSANALYSIRPDLFCIPDKRWKKAWDLKKNYGITRTLFDSIITAQAGLCKVCGKPPYGRGRFSVLHVDHNHKTGKIRGLLCGKCNLAIGHAEDNPTRLQELAAYLIRAD